MPWTYLQTRAVRRHNTYGGLPKSWLPSQMNGNGLLCRRCYFEMWITLAHRPSPYVLTTLLDDLSCGQLVLLLLARGQREQDWQALRLR
jgi:hypothetical protein